MPTYSYKCTQCDAAFDIQQAFTDDSLSLCPSCSGRLRKVFTSIGVTFNGSGFYRNDSRAAAREHDSQAAGGKETGNKESGTKETGTKETGTKETGKKETTAPAANGGGSSDTSKPSAAKKPESSSATVGAST